MLNRLRTNLSALPRHRNRERGNHELPEPAVSQPGWGLLVLLLIALVLPGGCGAPAAQLPAKQMVAQVDSQAKQNRLQEQLLKQVAQVSVMDYKDYKVGPEDLLEIRCMSTDKLNTEARVNGQGEIRLLLIGDVKVADLTPDEVAKKLIVLYEKGDYLKNPQFTVAVKEYRHQRVAVTGAVSKPDYYSLIGPRTLLEVLGIAGGLSDKSGELALVIRAKKRAPISKAAASPREPFSPGAETIAVDLNRLLLKGDAKLNLPIQNGDVVYIPYAQTAYVLGAVNKPGGVLLKDNMTVTKAIAQAGGIQLLLGSYSATLMRMDENGERQIIPVNLGQITKGHDTDLPLKENDIVFVQESSVRRFLFDFKMLMPGSLSLPPGMF